MSKKVSRVTRCVSCGNPKPAGSGRKLCDSCKERSLAENRSKQAIERVCKKCKTEKVRKRHLYCDDCKELLAWERKTRQAAIKKANRKPCRRCGGKKPPGEGRSICDACRESVYEQGTCMKCRGPKPKSTRRFCDKCQQQSIEHRRKKQREWAQKKRKNDPKAAERMRKANRKWRRGKGKKRVNEYQSMRYRMRALSEGREVRQGTERNPENKVVSSEPLVPFLRVALKQAASEVEIEHEHLERDFPGIDRLSKSVGVASKQIAGYLRGNPIRVNEADKMCIALGLAFSMLWTEEDVRSGGQFGKAA